MFQVLKKNWLSWCAVVISLAIAASFMNQLPEQLPIHFNTHGQADRYSSKFFALLFLPCISVLTVLFASSLLRQSPEGYKAEHSTKKVAKINFGITLFLMMTYLASLREALEPRAWIAPVIPLGLSLLTIFLGNYFGTIERNFVFGFRLPWTLASEDNWKQTHRFAARAFVTVGLIALVWSCVRPNFIAPVIGIVGSSALAVLFSYRTFRKSQNQN